MNRKTNPMKIKKTPVYSSSSSYFSSTRRLVDRVGFGRNRRRRLELRLRLRFRRLLREKKSNDVSPESKIRIEDEWIDWMILWKNAATAAAASAAITDPTTITIQDSELEVEAVLLNQAFRKRTELVEKESYLSPIDAAMIIQSHFRAHLIRKSKAIQALRELAIANTKLKEIRNLYNNGLSFLRRLSQDAEERQRFQEKIIVLLLTVDAIDRATVKLRLGQKIIIDELETMLDKTEISTPSKLNRDMAGKGAVIFRRVSLERDQFTPLKINDGNVDKVDMDEEGAVILRRAFGKEKKKRKEMSPEEAAIKIQIRFREYLVRKLQALRANEELALAKAKLEEIRDLFNNSFSNRVYLDEGGNDEERMRFSEKIIVLLLTVDAIEGANVEARGFKRAMVNELEAMLEIVDPQPVFGIRKKIMVDGLETLLYKTDKFTPSKIDGDYNDMDEQGAVLLRRAFGKEKKKRKEMSPEEAAIKIQIRFREYLVRKEQALRANEELALAKAKLEEIRGLFNNNFSNRGGNDEERMRFFEKIIVLLLTVDGIEGANVEDRGSKRDMVKELEEMLEIVDPQPD